MLILMVWLIVMVWLPVVKGNQKRPIKLHYLEVTYTTSADVAIKGVSCVHFSLYQLVNCELNPKWQTLYLFNLYDPKFKSQNKTQT